MTTQGRHAPGSLGILRLVHTSGRIGQLTATLTRSSATQTLRNSRLLATSALQHLVDDPAMLAIQVSRRLPFGPRMAVGRALESAGVLFPALGALGAVMAGRDANAEAAVLRARSAGGDSFSRLAGEVAILLDRPDLIPENAPAATRARAAWSRGAMSTALSILEDAGAHDSLYARRLRSENQLLEPGSRLPVPMDHESDPSALDEAAPLRVLHLLTNSLPHTQSGYSLRSHRILTALRDQGIESVALTRTGYPVMIGKPLAADQDVVDGIRYVRTLPARLPATQHERLEAEVVRALELVAEFRPHIIHATTNYLNALVAQAVSDATGIPWVFEVRGLMEETWVASRRSDEARAEAARSERHELIARKEASQARAADALVTLSRTMADELVERGADRASITLVPNGVEDALFGDHVSTAQARELIGLVDHPGFGSDALLVGAVSALVDYEGFDTLLRALALLRDDRTTPQILRDRLRVVLVGDGAARPGLVALVDELGLADHVLMPGRVPREQARRWVEALDAVVVPRRDVAVARAVTPQKPVEAMALGRPLIMSDLPALREVVTSAPGGEPLALLVRPDDPEELAGALRRLVTGRDEVGAGEEDTMLVARQRSWPQLMRRYGEVYERVTRPTARGDGSGD